jgi:predicted metal-dependent hydrolase
MINDSVAIDILKRMSRRSISLHITDEGLLEVRAPHFVPRFMIDRFVESRKDWIIRTKKRMAVLPKSVKQSYKEGSVIRIAGEAYAFHITEGNSIVMVGKRIFLPKKFARYPKKHMELFLRTFAKKYLTERSALYAKAMGVAYRRISIRDTSSRWGSCSSTGTISYSYRLVLAEQSIIDYVVIHELSHVTHHHHQQAFWNRVGEFYPEYKAARAWLRKHGHTLHV